MSEPRRATQALGDRSCGRRNGGDGAAAAAQKTTKHERQERGLAVVSRRRVDVVLLSEYLSEACMGRIVEKYL